MADQLPPTKRPARRSSRTTVAPEVLDSATDKFREELEASRKRLEEQAAESAAYEQAYKLPGHSKPKDFKGAYVLGEGTLRAINDQVTDLLKSPLLWTVTFADSHVIADLRFDELLSQPLVKSRQIQFLTASGTTGSKPPLARFSFRLNDSSFTAGRMDISAKDQGIVERIDRIVSEEMGTCRTWYGFALHPGFEAAMFPILGVGGAALYYALWPRVAEILILTILGFAALASRAWLFRKIEYGFGYSERMMLKRKTIRKVLGPILILGTALSVLQQLIANSILTVL